MYFKLAFRNANRSISDYLLYIFSMIILTSILYVSNCFANWGDMTMGFWTISLSQVIDLKKEKRNIWFLFYAGKNQRELKYLLCTQVLIKLFQPVLIAFFMLWAAVPFINYKINSICLVPTKDFLLSTICNFMFCFFLLYFCYFFIVYKMSIHYIRKI